MARSVNKKIRFGFFECAFICDTDELNKTIKKYNKSQKQEEKVKANTLSTLQKELKNPSLLFSNILDAIQNTSIDFSHDINGKLIEADLATFITNSEKTFLQVINNRDDAISKKRLGESRERIDLKDDEYISESTSIMYNRSNNTLLAQYNKYAVSIGQLGCFFSICLSDYFQHSLNKSEKIRVFPAKIEFKPVIAMDRLNEIKTTRCIEKMTIKGSLSGIENIRKESSVSLPIFNIANSISNLKGYEFSITLTANKTREGRKVEYDSIDQQFCSDLYDAYEKVGTKDNIDVEMQFQNENSIREVLKWSSPIKEVFITFSVSSREEIPIEDFFKKMNLQL